MPDRKAPAGIPNAVTVTDVATRAYKHNLQLDPSVRSLLDADFYKLPIVRMIRHLHPQV